MAAEPVADGNRQYLTLLYRLTALKAMNVNSAIHSLVIDGIFTGVGSVLSFLPVIVTLFFFLSLMEDSGYIARVAFVMDKLLRKIGLSGKQYCSNAYRFWMYCSGCHGDTNTYK